MTVATDAILFYGYCWDDEAHAPWEIDVRGRPAKEETDEDESDWETRYARLKGCLPPSAAFPDRAVPPTRENGYDSTPKDYSRAEQAIIDQHRAYGEAKRKIVAKSPCVVGTHCSASCPMPYVAVRTSETHSHRGHPSKIAGLAADPSWNQVLAEFCAEMGIKIGNKKAAWWLVSAWSD